MRNFALAVLALVTFTPLTGCSEGSEPQPTKSFILVIPTPSNSPSVTTEEELTGYPPLTKKDFTSAGYTPTKVEGEWENKTASGLPVLIVRHGQIDGFRIDGFECEAVMYGLQLTPVEAKTMAVTASMYGIKPGRRPFMVDSVEVGAIDCARVG